MVSESQCGGVRLPSAGVMPQNRKEKSSFFESIFVFFLLCFGITTRNGFYYTPGKVSCCSRARFRC